jgi:hypothetical protein
MVSETISYDRSKHKPCRRRRVNDLAYFMFIMRMQGDTSIIALRREGCNNVDFAGR